MTFRRTWLFALLGAMLWSAPTSTWASSHREAPAITEDPAADNTDLYAWVTPNTHDKLHVVANWNPLQQPAGGPNFHKFSDDVLYSIHITRGGSSLDDVITYHFEFKSARAKTVKPDDQNATVGGGKEFFRQLAGVEQTYTVYKTEWTNRRPKTTVLARNVNVAPPNIGPRTNQVAYKITAYDDTFAKTFIKDLGTGGSEGRVWAGPRDDGFYVDLGGVFDLANLRAKGTAQDGVAGFNVHSIALEIPTTKLTFDGQAPANKASAENTLGVWASSSRRRIQFRLWSGRNVSLGPWVQVSRLGLPLVNEALIGLQDKDRYNAGHPKTDAARFGAYFLNPVVVRDAEAVGIYTALGADPTPFKFNRTDILDIISIKTNERAIQTVGDVLRVDLGQDSSFPNGRPIPGGATNTQEQADVTDVLLSVILSKGAVPVKDGVDYNDKPFLSEMPWLPLPHEGYSGGHGKTTP
ncbi:MAG: DUF4331 domain-containing protein [Myxococcales bacterium]|nr:DUF4331 domain-containing protein [Myxococcales bacterium]MCB9641844.1 DUF4331 domain-containing protein [Myxococcales bacterium]